MLLDTFNLGSKISDRWKVPGALFDFLFDETAIHKDGKFAGHGGGFKIV